ncbi:unnamed protein product [Eruca vesicaria subsp. sativa]|uniref:PH domain-containing protein n=1 Tax=Eruca vesicaria subsp. sativa TaxID=29727 RepID=A0ABC8IXW5_ERUVS|nr:unnamed protein product [Eruca vesicaria subsp. sativa]
MSVFYFSISESNSVRLIHFHKKCESLVYKLGKKKWRGKDESDNDEDDEVKKDTSEKRSASLDDPEERREWRKKIREVIDNHPDVEEEEIDMVEKRRKMQKLLADYPLVVNEEDPNYISSSLVLCCYILLKYI